MQHWYIFGILNAWLVGAADELWTARKAMPSLFAISADALIGRAVETALTLNIRLTQAQVATLESAIVPLLKDAAPTAVLSLPTPIFKSTPNAPPAPTGHFAPSSSAPVTSPSTPDPDSYRPKIPTSAAPRQTSKPLAGHTDLDANRPLGTFAEEKKTVADELEQKLCEVDSLLEKSDFQRPHLPGWSVFVREAQECYAIAAIHLMHIANVALRAEGGLVPEMLLKDAAAAAGADPRQLRLLLILKATLSSYGLTQHSALSARPFLRYLMEVLRTAGNPDFLDYDGSRSQDLLDPLLATTTALWDQFGEDVGVNLGIQTSTSYRCLCTGLSLADAIAAKKVQPLEGGKITAYTVVPLNLDPDFFGTGDEQPNLQTLLWHYFTETDVIAPAATCCTARAGTNFLTLHSCAHVFWAVIKRYTDPSAPLNHLRVNITDDVWLTDHKGDRHRYVVRGAALHEGPTLDSPSNHYTFILFNDSGPPTRLNDLRSRHFEEVELKTIVEPYVYAVALVRQSTTKAADIYGPHIPSCVGTYGWFDRKLGGRMIVDMGYGTCSASARVMALLDAPIKMPAARLPSSQSRFEAMDIDGDSIRRSSPAKAAIQAASKAPSTAVEVGIEVLNRNQLEDRFGKKPLRELGRGAFGQVSVCLDKTSGKKVAMKMVDMAKDDKYAKREAGAMVVINRGGGHRSVVKRLFIGCITDDSGRPQEMAIAMPLYAGDLAHIAALRSDIGRPLSAVEGRGAVFAVADALAYIHSMGIMHRDVKPQNCMVEASGAVVLGDFGAARRLAKEGEAEVTDIGSRDFMAPEVLLHSAGLQLPYGVEVDVFSTGGLWYWARQSQVLPFSGEKQQEAADAARQTDRRDKATQIQALIAHAYSCDVVSPSAQASPLATGGYAFMFFPDDDDDDLPAEEEALIQRCLSFQPSDRPTAQDLVSHPIFDPSSPSGLPHGPIRMPSLKEKASAAIASVASVVASAVSGAASSVAKALSPPPPPLPKLPAKRAFDQLPFSEDD